MSHDAGDLAAARAGDREAFARLYDRHAGVVLSFCRRHGLAEAEDAVQETFIRAYRMLDQLDGATDLRPWLYAIARRVCAERRRAARRRTRHEGLSMTSALLHRAAEPTPADGLAASDDLDRLTIALGELADDERLAVHLFYLEDDPVSAASAALGLSRSGFYKLLARARERLASLMRQAAVR